MLYVDPAWAESVVGEIGKLDSVALKHVPGDRSTRLVHARLTALNSQLFGAASDEDKLSALVLFIGDLFGPAEARFSARTGKPEMRRLQEVKAMISARCCESLALDDLAYAAQMSRYHFVRLFRRSFGMTPHAWQIDQRIVLARVLIDLGMPLAEVALQLGFSDQSHFQRAFKQRVAVTPGEYRNAAPRRNFIQY